MYHNIGINGNSMMYNGNTRGDQKIFGLFMLLSFHVQLLTHIDERKLHLIAYKSISLFLVRSFVHLNKVGVRATIVSKLKEQRSIKFLLFEGEKHCHIFKGGRKVFLKLAYPVQLLIAGFHNLTRAGLT